MAELKARGMQVNDIAPTERDRMRQMVKPVHAKFSAEYDPKAVKVFNAELERIQKLK